jgi:hypothetical protein
LNITVQSDDSHFFQALREQDAEIVGAPYWLLQNWRRDKHDSIEKKLWPRSHGFHEGGIRHSGYLIVILYKATMVGPTSPGLFVSRKGATEPFGLPLSVACRQDSLLNAEDTSKPHFEMTVRAPRKSV